MPEDNREQPGHSTTERTQPKGPLQRMEVRERPMKKQLDEIDEHIRRAKVEQKQRVGQQSQES